MPAGQPPLLCFGSQTQITSRKPFQGLMVAAFLEVNGFQPAAWSVMSHFRLVFVSSAALGSSFILGLRLLRVHPEREMPLEKNQVSAGAAQSVFYTIRTSCVGARRICARRRPPALL